MNVFVLHNFPLLKVAAYLDLERRKVINRVGNKRGEKTYSGARLPQHV